MEEQEIEILPLSRSEYISDMLTRTFRKKHIYIILALVITSNLSAIYANIRLKSIGLYVFIISYDILMIGLFWFPPLIRYKKYARMTKEGVKSFISISQEKIKIRNSIGKNDETSWKSITEIENKPKILAIYTDTSKRPIGITKRSFHSKVEAEQFISKLETYWRNSKTP